MSIHPSLRSSNTLVGERSVLTRTERLTKLHKDGKIDPEQRAPWGLPKVRTKFKVAGKKKADAAPAEGAAKGAAAAGAKAPAAKAPAAKAAAPAAKAPAKK
jgi:small basic protein (TIGR04137 family)